MNPRKKSVFVSFVAEDRSLATEVSEGLEAAGYSTWLYTRDALPGPSYLLQTREAIEACDAFLLLISPQSLSQGEQITIEITRALSSSRRFIPVLVGVSFDDLQLRRPDWAQAIGAASALGLDPGMIPTAVSRIAEGLANLGIAPRATTPTVVQSAVAQSATVPGNATPKHIVLLYKRNAQPDEDVLRLLESELARRGHTVFFDKRLHTGVQWATEIEAKVRAADAVIPVLSIASMGSEMLEEELRIAREAGKQSGKPLMIPIRVNYDGRLPEPLAGMLDPIQYFLWHGTQDNAQLLDEIAKALARPPAPEVRVRRPAGGAIPLDSKVYIVRATDERFQSAITRGESIVLVNGSRQMGKTSLLVRGLQLARQAKKRVLLTDFQKLNAEDFASADSFFQALANLIAERLDPEPDVAAVWRPSRAPSLNFERFMKREVLGKDPSPLVWGMDEVDRLFPCPYASDVFGLFRSWHNERSLEPDGPWGQLTLAIVYATEANLFITDPNQSPFNVGTKFPLSDFTLEEVAEFDRRYQSPLGSPDRLNRFYALLGGHPFLVHQGLEELSHPGASLEQFEARADSDDGPYADHLRRIVFLLGRDESLRDSVRAVLNGEKQISFEHFFRLRTAGVVAGESSRQVRLRCALYERYLKRHV